MSSLYDSAASIAHTFEMAYCMRCVVVDLSLEDGFESRKYDPFCALCSAEQKNRGCQLLCENIHRHGVMQAEKWGGKYEYLCPAGLAFLSTPMRTKGETMHGIVAGPFLMVDLQDFKDEDLDRIFSGHLPKALLSEADQLRFISSGRVSYIANMLSMMAAYAAEKDSFQFMLTQQVAKSQSDVFELLCGLEENAAYNYPIQQEKLLQGYIAHGDKASAQRVLNEILGHIFFCSGGQFEYIKARIIELVVLLSRAAIEGGADITEVFGLNCDYINDVQRFKSLDELNHWLANVLVRFTSIVFEHGEVKHNEVIKRVVEFIRRNYMNKISLNDISGHTKLSVSYLSKVFKDETGTSISAYINQVRIENAKLFLLDERIPLSEVAYLSGFEDQSYFSKVFKKITKVTPGKYREKKGNL